MSVASNEQAGHPPAQTPLRSRSLADVLGTIFKGRKSAYAIRRSQGGYSPARNAGKDIALSNSIVESHLNGGQSIGIYFMEPGDDRCAFGVFDIDDHKGDAGWDHVVGVARRISEALKARDIRFVAFRSGGGCGIHVVVPFRLPVNAAALRRRLKELLRSLRMNDGPGGIHKNEVEIFPKQNHIKAGEYGSLVALPLARESRLLDNSFQLTGADPKAFLESLVPNEVEALASGSACASTSATNTTPPELETSATASSAEGGDHPLSKCLFIHHCEANAAVLSEPLWYAAACNLAATDGGADYFHSLSARDTVRYDQANTEAKLKHALDSDAPHTCMKISELGFTCPKMQPDGHCTITGGRQPISFAKTVRQLIADLRRVKAAPVRHRKIAALVINQLKLEGTFYVANDDGSLHYFYNNEKRLYSILSADFKAFCSDLFGMNAAEQEYKFVLADIETHAMRFGTAAEFFRFARYAKGVLYINAGQHRVLRLDGINIHTVDNGTDGILFRNTVEVESIHQAESHAGSPVRDHLVKALNCKDGALLDLYEVYIYSLFFESLLPTKPIALITGVKGAGKSFAGRALKRALFGGQSDVDVGLTDDEKNAKAAFANNYFLCMDNVDGKVNWMANLLASVSTGTQIRERKLYANNQEVAFTPRCFVMINSRDPMSLKRDDIVDRLLIFPVERFQQFIPDAQLLDAISKSRPAIWSELLANLNRIVLRLRTGVPLTIKDQRLADFANVGMVIANVINAKRAKEAFANLEESRNSLVLENHPLLTALNLYIANHAEPVWIKTGALLEELRRVSNYAYTVKSPQYFGQQLKNLSSNLSGYIDIEFRSASHNLTEVRIGALGQLTRRTQGPASAPATGTPGTAKSNNNKSISKKTP